MSKSDLLNAFSEEEFRTFVLGSDERHEFVDGAIRSMTPKSIRQDLVTPIWQRSVGSCQTAPDARSRS
jgi:hypothetical protein